VVAANREEARGSDPRPLGLTMGWLLDCKLGSDPVHRLVNARGLDQPSILLPRDNVPSVQIACHGEAKQGPGRDRPQRSTPSAGDLRKQQRPFHEQRVLNLSCRVFNACRAARRLQQEIGRTPP